MTHLWNTLFYFFNFFFYQKKKVITTYIGGSLLTLKCAVFGRFFMFFPDFFFWIRSLYRKSFELVYNARGIYIYF